ncbi:MAG: SpaA isopeptide-forming pilin-related protein, partial [Coriobacteriia bacterium]|nr:SpaA isopeptide-forming pilin-related protein [Coriobacteriia bacterium]
ELAPGVYTVTETLQTGWTNTTDLAQDVTVVDDQTAELWFGNVMIPEDDPAGDIKVYKFNDLNENGEYDDDEPMLEDWEFTLTQSTSVPAIPQLSAIAIIDSGFTDAGGELSFTELAPGVYTVTETLQTGWTNTTDLAQDVTVVDDQTAELWFGNVEEFLPYTDGRVLVHKFNDLNENGLYEENEPMLEDWEFTLTQSMPVFIEPSAISLVDSGLTNAAGELLFDELPVGEYTVTETMQEGWINTTPLSQSVTVVEEETTHVWFGNVEDPFMPFTELDLAITKSVDKTTAAPGELLTYTLTYWNTSDVVAYDFTITDDFDQRYVNVVGVGGGTVADGKIVWNLAGPLTKADGKQTITYTTRVIDTMAIGTTNIDNIVMISHPEDSDPSNNTDDARTVVRVAGDPFLPFTGSEYLLLVGLAAVAATAGTLVRVRSKSAA